MLVKSEKDGTDDSLDAGRVSEHKTMGRVLRRTSTKQRSMALVARLVASEMLREVEKGEAFGQVALASGGAEPLAQKAQAGPSLCFDFITTSAPPTRVDLA
jgi:hypothetical protein